jgi:hypothetical protein
MPRLPSSDFYGVRLKPELLTVLRHAGIDLLAYDGALCSEVASPLAEAVLRIAADPGLRALFRSVVGCDDSVMRIRYLPIPLLTCPNSTHWWPVGGSVERSCVAKMWPGQPGNNVSSIVGRLSRRS